MSEYIQGNFSNYYLDELESRIGEKINFDPFPPSTNTQEEREIDYKELYFIGRPTQVSTSANDINDESRILFIIRYQNPLGHKKKSGNGGRKYDPDNILSKQEVAYNEFILDYLNQNIDELDVHKKIKNRFKKIKHDLKKNVTKEKFEILIKKKLSDIVSQNISDKFKHFETEHNIKLYEEIKKNLPIMEKILDENYLTLFRNVYYPSKREINLKTLYGIDKTIYLSDKVKMFKDLINKFKKKDEYYASKFYKVVNEYYFEGKLKFFAFN